MSANDKMPQGEDYVSLNPTHFNKLDFDIDAKQWLNSLQPCEISESELNKIYTHLSIVVTDVCLRDYIKNQIEVTDIISDNNGVITFKHPKQVGEIEAVDSEQIIKFIAQRIKDEQRKHEQFQDMWHEIAARKIYKSFNITTRNI